MVLLIYNNELNSKRKSVRSYIVQRTYFLRVFLYVIKKKKSLRNSHIIFYLGFRFLQLCYAVMPYYALSKRFSYAIYYRLVVNHFFAELKSRRC